MCVDLRAAHFHFLLRALGCHVVYFTSTHVISSTIRLFCAVCLFVCHRQNSNFSVSCINEGHELVLTDTFASPLLFALLYRSGFLAGRPPPASLPLPFLVTADLVLMGSFRSAV